MSRELKLAIAVFCIIACTSCGNRDASISAFPYPYGISPTGKFKNAEELPSILSKSGILSLRLPSVTPKEIKAIRHQQRLLEIQRRGKRNFVVGNKKFTRDDLKRASELLEAWAGSALIPPEEYFDLYQSAGKDGKGNVKFTGYYSPVLSVSSVRTEEFKYPFYSYPKGISPLPTRKDIHMNGALKGKGLEIAYANDLLEIQRMQLQGSGFVRFEDGSLRLLSFNGTNKKPRRSIQAYFKKKYAEKGVGVTLGRIKKFLRNNPDKYEEIVYHNPSYVFFSLSPKGRQVKGSGNVPLTPGISVATDKRYFPSGSSFIALKPVPKKNHTEHESVLLLAQDVGGGIKGPGRLDLYTGIGNKALRDAELNHYGNLWLLLPKK